MPVTVVSELNGATRAKQKSSTCCRNEHAYVVRYQGGHNAGHTVVVDGEKVRTVNLFRREFSTRTSSR